jgi:tRNA 2-thiouridine synthesizing protein A
MTVPDLTHIQAAKVVDARGTACAGPLLEAKKGITSVKVGEILEVWTSDTNAKADMPDWCQQMGHEFLGVLQGVGYERLFIRRRKAEH